MAHPPLPDPQYWLNLALRAYPTGPSHLCSIHRGGDKTGKCRICFPNYKNLIIEHTVEQHKLYDKLLQLSGLSDPPNGRIGTNAIIEELQRKLKSIKQS